MSLSTCLPLCALFGSFCAPTSWAQGVFVRHWKRVTTCLTPFPQCVGVVNVYYSEEEAPAKCAQSPFNLFHGDGACQDPEGRWVGFTFIPAERSRQGVCQ